MTDEEPGSRCFECRGPREDGCVQHRPGCSSYSWRDMFGDGASHFHPHPDLVDIEASMELWYQDGGAA